MVNAFQILKDDEFQSRISRTATCMNWVQNKDIFEIKDSISSLPTHAIEGYATVNSVKPEKDRDTISRNHRLNLKKQP